MTWKKRVVWWDKTNANAQAMWFPPVKIHFNWLDTRNHSMKIPHGKLFHSSAGATAAASLAADDDTECVSGHIGSRRLSLSRSFYIDHYFIRLKSNRDFNSIISIYFVDWRKIKSIYMDIDDDLRRTVYTHTPNHITYAFDFPWLGNGNASTHTTHKHHRDVQTSMNWHAR